MLTNSALPQSIDAFLAEGGHAPLPVPAALPLPVQVELERNAQAVRRGCQDYVMALINKGI